MIFFMLPALYRQAVSSSIIFSPNFSKELPQILYDQVSSHLVFLFKLQYLMNYNYFYSLSSYSTFTYFLLVVIILCWNYLMTCFFPSLDSVFTSLIPGKVQITCKLLTNGSSRQSWQKGHYRGSLSTSRSRQIKTILLWDNLNNCLW